MTRAKGQSHKVMENLKIQRSEARNVCSYFRDWKGLEFWRGRAKAGRRKMK